MNTANQRQLALIPTPERPPLIQGKPTVTGTGTSIDHSGCRDDGELVKLFLKTRARSPRTHRVYQHELRRFKSLVPKSLRTITLSDLQGYVIGLDRLNLATATRARAISTVRGLLRFAQETGYTAFDVGRAVRPPRREVTSGQRYLTPGEAERLLDAAHGDDLVVVALLLGTGLRCAELASASWGDLYSDPSGRVGLRVNGKGERVREVKIRSDLWTILVANRTRRSLATDLDPNDDSPLVINRFGTRLSERGIHRAVVRSGKRAGLKKSVSPHWLRHTFGTLSAQGGASVYQVQNALGHQNLGTTTIYIHAARGLVDTAVDHLPIEFQVPESGAHDQR